MEPEETREERKGRGLGSRALICLLAALAWLLLFLMGSRPLSSSATFLALDAGRLIVESSELPAADTFTHTAEGREWLPAEWLSFLLLHEMKVSYGYAGIRLFGGLAALLAVAVVSGALWRDAPDLPRAAGGTVLAACLLLPQAGALPDLLGALCALLLFLGLTMQTERARPQDIAPAAILTAIGVNLSPLTLLAIPLLALHLLGDVLSRPSRRRGEAPVPSAGALTTRTVCLGAAVAASLANPWLWRIWAHLLADVQARLPFFHGRGPFPLLPGEGRIGLATWVGALLALLLVLLNLAGVLFLRGTRPLPRAAFPGALTSVAVAALVLYNQRLLWLLAIPVVQSLRSGSPLSVAFERKGFARFLERRRGRLATVAVLALLFLPLVWDGQVRGTVLAAAAVEPYLAPVDTGALPVAAVSFARDAGVRGRLYHEPGWGGYLSYALPSRSTTFVDERTGVFPPHVIDAVEEIASGGDDAGRLLRDYGVEVLIVRDDFPEPRDGSGDWTPVFRNRTAAVLVFRGPHGWENLARAASHYRRSGLPQQSADAYVEAAIIEANPNWAREHELLERRPLSAALALYESLDTADRPEGKLAALRKLGNLYARVGLDESALREWERGLRVQPRDRNLLWNVAMAQVKLERWAEARRSLQTYMALHPGDEEAERILAALDQLHPF